MEVRVADSECFLENDVRRRRYGSNGKKVRPGARHRISRYAETLARAGVIDGREWCLPINAGDSQPVLQLFVFRGESPAPGTANALSVTVDCAFNRAVLGTNGNLLVDDACAVRRDRRAFRPLRMVENMR